MNATIVHAAQLAALLALSAPGAYAQAAPVGEKTQKQCFWTRDVNGFRAVDNRTVMLRTGVKDVYRLDLFAPCPEVNWSESIAIVSRGTTTICSGLDAEIVTPSSIGPQTCAVRVVRKLTPAEVEALPPKQRP